MDWKSTLEFIAVIITILTFIYCTYKKISKTYTKVLPLSNNMNDIVLDYNLEETSNIIRNRNINNHNNIIIE